MDNLVSVIIPCFNDGAYLEECLQSVQMQSYKAIEVIVVDDGSDDPVTQEVLGKIRHQSGVRVLTGSHEGPAAARNLGIEHAEGAFVMPLDADDRIGVTYIEHAAEVLMTRPGAGIVYCQAELFGQAAGSWQLPPFSMGEMLAENVIFVTALFRRADWLKVGGYSQDFSQGIEDYDFWLSLLELGREVVCLPEVSFFYRIREKSRNQNFTAHTEQALEMYRILMERHRLLYERHLIEYTSVLRGKLLQQRNYIKKLERSSAVFSRLKCMLDRMPLLKRLMKNILKIGQ